MEEVAIKTHLIITDIHEEYDVKWCGKIIDTQPIFENGKPVFILISSTSRLELNTIDMKYIEECAKRITNPRGRSAVTTDKTYIYIKEITGENTCIGVVTHNHVKSYAPMYDKVGYR